MKVYEHNDYNKYVSIQKNHAAEHVELLKKQFGTDGFKLLDGDALGWVKKEYLDRIFTKLQGYLNSNIVNPTMICHGVRCGYEAKYFMDRFGVDSVYSTDLADVFMFDRKHFFVQDFDKLPKEWVSKFDVLYSNVIDHSRQPKVTLKNWSLQIKDGGVMVVTFGVGDKVNDCDCFVLKSVDEVATLIEGTNLSILGYCDDYPMSAVDVYFRKEKAL